MSDRHQDDSTNQELRKQSRSGKTADPEGTTSGDPAMSEAGLDKVMSRVEGKKEPGKSSASGDDTDLKSG